MKQIRLIVADDHRMFINGLTLLLQDIAHMTLVATTTSGAGVLELLKHQEADVVITDISMPGMDGTSLTREIKKMYPQVKVLALTMHGQPGIISSMIKSGASGYLLKDADTAELIAAIETIAGGGTYFSDDIKNSLVESLIPGQKNNPDTFHVELSTREKEILKLIAEENTQQEIAEKLFISPHTVIFHRRKLLQKFNVKNTAGLIKAAMEKGFLS